jgi:hypothetical protein
MAATKKNVNSRLINLVANECVVKPSAVDCVCRAEDEVLSLYSCRILIDETLQQTGKPDVVLSRPGRKFA